MSVEPGIVAAIAVLVLFVLSWGACLLVWATLLAWLPERLRRGPWFGDSPRRRRWAALAVSFVVAGAGAALIASQVHFEVSEKIG